MENEGSFQTEPFEAVGGMSKEITAPFYHLGSRAIRKNIGVVIEFCDADLNVVTPCKNCREKQGRSLCTLVSYQNIEPGKRSPEDRRSSYVVTAKLIIECTGEENHELPVIRRFRVIVGEIKKM